MPDINIIRKFYEQCKDMDINDSMELLLSAEKEEEQDFISLISGFVLQQKQKEVLDEKIYLIRRSQRGSTLVVFVLY